MMMKEDKEENIKRFIDFLYAHGFDNPDIKNIIEIGYNPDTSVTPLLDGKKYNSLLVTMDEYCSDEMPSVNMITGGIVNNELFMRMDKDSYRLVHHSYLSHYDTLLTYGFGNQKRHALYTLKNMRKFVGERVLFDALGKRGFFDNLYASELSFMQDLCDEDFELIKEVDESGYGLYLIKSKEKTD